MVLSKSKQTNNVIMSLLRTCHFDNTFRACAPQVAFYIACTVPFASLVLAGSMGDGEMEVFVILFQTDKESEAPGKKIIQHASGTYKESWSRESGAQP